MLKNTIYNFKAFVLIFILALGLRITGLTFDSLWLDESYQSLTEAYGEKIPDLTNLNGGFCLIQHQSPSSTQNLLKSFRDVDPLCPPLYAVTLNDWIKIFGGSDFSVRSLSILFSLISLIIIFIVVLNLFNYPIALMASLVLAISPFDVSYAQEARMYTLTFGLSILSGGLQLITVKNIIENKNRLKIFIGLLGFSLATVALINTHYTNILLLAFEILYAFYISYKLKRLDILFYFFVSGIMILLMFLPWLNLFLLALKAPHAVFYVARQPSWWWPLYALTVRLPLNFILFLSGKKIILPCIALYLSSAYIFYYAFRLIFLEYKKDNIDTKQNLINLEYLFLWLVIPSSLLLVLDIVKNQRLIEISRYSYYIAPSAIILAGYALYKMAQFKPKIYKVIILSQAVFCLINISYTHIVYQKEPWREIAHDLNKYNANQYYVFISQFYNIVCLDRYLTRPYKQIGLSPAMGQAKIDTIFHKFQPVKFILITAQEGESIKNMLPKEYSQAFEKNYFHGLHLRVYKKNN